MSLRKNLPIPAALVLLTLALPEPLMAQKAQMRRPGAASGPTEVLLSIIVVDVFAINDAEESFVADFAVSMSWRDERLAWEEETEISTVEYGLEEVWNPGMVIVNGRGLSNGFPEVVEVEPDGTVHYLQRYQGALSAAFDLRDFPDDRQRLPVRLVFVGHSPQDLRPKLDQGGSSMLESAVVRGWRIRLVESSVDPVMRDENRALAGYTFNIVAQREAAYFIWTMMLPLTLIVLMAWMVFWIDPSFLPSQIGLSTASVFSLIAYRTALRLALPAVTYMTKADIFILGTTVLVFGALAHAVGTGRLAKTGREELARSIERWVRWVYVFLFAVTIAAAILW